MNKVCHIALKKKFLVKFSFFFLKKRHPRIYLIYTVETKTITRKTEPQKIKILYWQTGSHMAIAHENVENDSFIIAWLKYGEDVDVT